MGQTPPIARLLSHGRWRGQEVAHVILSAAEELGGGREPMLTEGEAARLRHGLSPEEWREYAWWGTGSLFIEDHVLPAGRIAGLEATRGLLAAEVLLTRVLDLAVYRPNDVDAVTAWRVPVSTLLTDLQPYLAARGRTLAWLAAGAEAFRAALGLTALRAGELLQELMAELEAALAHTRELLTLLQVLDIELPTLPALDHLGPDEGVIHDLERRMRSGRSRDWPTLWAWWLAQAEALPAQP